MRLFPCSIFVTLGLALSLALGLVAPLQAQTAPDVPYEWMQDVTYAECIQGAGCRCGLSGITAADMAWLLSGQAPPQSVAKLILLKDAGGTRWSPLTVEAADAQYGGDGVCPLEVFGKITPRDGAWVGKVRTTSITGCAPQVAEMVPGMVGSLSFSRQILWDGTFHPVKLGTDPGSPLVAWTELSPTLFSGNLKAPIKSDILRVAGNLTAKLVDEDHAVATLWLKIGAAAGIDAAVLASIGMADCRTTAVYDFRRVGP